MRKKKEVTMQDIADQMNISKVTVSKALNNKEGVSDTLKDKIKEMANALGYQVPSNKLETQMSKNITIMVQEKFVNTNEYTTFYLRFYQRIASALNKEGYICNLFTIDHQKSDDKTLLSMLSGHQTSAIIMMGHIKKTFVQTVKNLNIPIIFLDCYDAEKNFDCILTDNYYSSYEITNHLLENDHRNIGFVGKINATSSIQDRFLGYCRSLIEAGIPIQNELIIDDRDEDGEEIDFVLPKSMPTAFVCNCDDTAFKVVEKLKKEGYGVPEDVSIVGFDNDFYAELCQPKLTTVAVDVEAMVEKTVMLVTKKIETGDRNSKVKFFVAGKIVYRDSVKKNMKK